MDNELGINKREQIGSMNGMRHRERVALGAQALLGERYVSREMPSFFIFL